ncbi:hypothetical protein LY90DRAFT_669820 [Neocallimastix californiae]|uniref:Uncharacterized protein n=1 Tax=Neocallimastix californiae TaxID=1754190 RepID=A0A1Y2D761_9FUNG|nr:hypothetical protein LY90DRAFT_669820 [Neocallimastix californiae]|eukprot:ORY54926.1 hypothetical protein LY90DRAFT_669820 [Neocallimastix californiae]
MYSHRNFNGNTLITLDSVSSNNNENKINGPLRATKRHKPVNYIQELFIRNFEIQCRTHLSYPEVFSKLFIFPSLTTIPNEVKKVHAQTTNKKIPLSIFYHSDRYLKKCLLKLRKLQPNQQNYEKLYTKLTKKIFKTQKSIFYAICLIYRQMREYNTHSRNYRLWIPGGERCLHKNYYSGYVFFAAQTLLYGFALPRLEDYTIELQNRALDLYSSLNTLYQVLYQRMTFNLEPPYTDLVPYLCDFDKFWLLFEKRLYTCYHNIFHINKIKNSQIVKVFQSFMTKTLVYAVKKNYFTMDMAYEYDPLIMISLPRLTFVYVIYHLCNPFFFSNFPWFSKERYASIDKINQTFNLLNKKSVEKLEYYLIYGISTPTHLKHIHSSSSMLSPDTLINSHESKLLINQNETMLENEIKSPKTDVEEWSDEEEEDDDEGNISSSSLSSSENEIIGDILVKKVFKSVCSIVDEFQSNEVAKLLNTIMKGVFIKGIAKLEALKELEEEK